MNAAFLKGATWGFPGSPVEHIETHAAHVFLVENRAYKIKKPVKLPYLDFSTVEKRRAVLLEELEINRPHAPAIYRDVIEKLGEPVLSMSRFPTEALLSNVAASGGIDDELAGLLAETVARSHDMAPVRNVAGSSVMAGLGAQLSSAFTQSPDIFQAPLTLEFHALYEEALGRASRLLDQRSAAGLLRRCHGDMHCGNIVVIAGKPVLFDAIEFSEKIAAIDVLYDLAFLLMDLIRRGERRAANIVFNRYLHLRRGHEDLTGLAALPLFLATRAGVRALVAADLIHELQQAGSLKQWGEARDYFLQCLAYLKPTKPCLVALGGLSGSGKSTVAKAMAQSIGAAPGALHVRSDLERKALAGVGETVRLPAASYTRQAAADVYRQMFARAEGALRAGHSAIVDAVFADPAERQLAESLARSVHVPFAGFWLEADPAILKTRVSGRTGDASDADAGVVEAQLGYETGQLTWARIDAGGSIEETARQMTRRLAHPAAP